MKANKMKITPYANESEVITIGNLTVENRIDRIPIHGDTDITRDLEGLNKARTLKALIDSILDVLEKEHLPDKITIIAPQSIPNPFAKK